jgi:ParB family transcriptional regulator, chromosome partitioning protein
MPHRVGRRKGRAGQARASGFAGYALAPAVPDAAVGRGLAEEMARREPLKEPPMNETSISVPSTPRLREVEPRSLRQNPLNPRVAPAGAAQDEQLRASIKARGIIQFPVVAEKDGELVIRAGHRRVKAAIDLDLSTIWVVESEPGNIDLMDALAENVIGASMTSVDTWRAIVSLEAQGWNDQAIADALAQPVRTVRRLKLLAQIHPPMLDAMARGDIPKDEQLRTIAEATIGEQAQVWKKHKPKKNESTNWFAVANALSKRRVPFSAAKFDEMLAEKYGVIWVEGLFAPAGEDNRDTTDVDGFFGAQQEWLENNLPKGGVLVPQDDYGQPSLPKKAERVYGKPAKGDIVGHYLDPRTAEVKTVTYRMAAEKTTAKGVGKNAAPTQLPEKAQRPDVTQKGNAIIGDLRTDTLHEALREDPASDVTLMAFLVLALGGRNVSVQSGVNEGRFDRQAICEGLIQGGVLTGDEEAVRAAARAMLVQTLSCGDNMSNSGIGARIAGETIGATLRLPSMATEEFLSCLSRQALEREAAANSVRVEARVKDTRAGMVRHFDGATGHYPDAVFALSKLEIEDEIAGAEYFGPETDQTRPTMRTNAARSKSPKATRGATKTSSPTSQPPQTEQQPGLPSEGRAPLSDMEPDHDPYPSSAGRSRSGAAPHARSVLSLRPERPRPQGHPGGYSR